jgi:hypothetical protein
MIGETTIERIANLREAAKNKRECAAHADRYEYSFAENQQALKLDQEADALERQLKAGVVS